MIRAALILACLCAALPAAAQEMPRLKRMIDFPADGSIPGNATIGQATVDYYDVMQRRHDDAYRTMSDGFVCKSAAPMMMGDVAKGFAMLLPPNARDALKRKEPTAFTSLAITVVGSMEGIDPASIRADEAIGPGVYNPAIVSIAYTIERCRFY